MAEQAYGHCQGCDAWTLHVCIACRRRTCHRCGRVAVEVFGHLGIPPEQNPPDQPLPVVCRGCRAR